VSSHKRWLNSRPVWVLILLIVVIPFQYYFARRQWSDRTLQEGRAAPQDGITDARGRAWSVSDEAGRFVVLSFWASWCGPCKRELPELDSLYRQLDSTAAIRIYAVNVDESERVAADYFDAAGLSLPLLYIGAAAASQEWSVSALPTLVVIDRQGEVIDVQTGYQAWGINALAYRLDESVPGAFGELTSPADAILGNDGEAVPDPTRVDPGGGP
jgi:thiol-disulfide isomerase/thioredoxin